MILPKTKEFLFYLNRNSEVRKKIRAEPNKTLLYAGRVVKEVWKEIEEERTSSGRLANKTTLHDVLKDIDIINSPYKNLLCWAEYIDQKYPGNLWKSNGYVVWRALSGIFASNAQGAVSFMMGYGVSAKNKKVFAVTEVHVLDRNPNIDQTTRDAVAYYLWCIREKKYDINLSLIHG